MRVVQIVNLEGPERALAVLEVPDPAPGERQVLIEVRAAGVAFPDLLQTRGRYQAKPDLPFVPGWEVAGIVRGAPTESQFSPGDRVAALTRGGGFAELAVANTQLVFPLHDELSFRQGAGLVLNYHTAWFCLRTRGGLVAGERVLVHGAAGGIGTATLQVARGLGAETVAVVSTDEKARVAREAGADHVLQADDGWRNRAKTLGGLDLIVDPVGGDRFLDSLRTLRPGGRLVIIGFTQGSIPEIKVNRLLLNNISLIGAGWAEWLSYHPDYILDTAVEIDRLIAGGHIRPLVGRAFPLNEAAAALSHIDGRAATGKVVLDVS